MGIHTGRRYEQTHPWLNFTFRADVDRLWLLLGEAYSKSRHLAGTPLQPRVATELARVYLVKGAVATTAIEGNTLTESEVSDLLETGRRLPPSQQYLQQEVENVLSALREIDSDARSGRTLDITHRWIRELNRRVLQGLELEPHEVPGEYTTVQLAVGPYRASPPEDVPYLVDRLCDWLAEWLAPLADPGTPEDMRFCHAFLAAVLGHLYIAWIHPFGQGNGRTARLVECAVLAQSGTVPWVSANLLSDHYNRTRGRYYDKLQRASREGDVRGFVEYSAQGFVDLLREQIDEVQKMQRRVAWVNFVHEVMAPLPTGDASRRRRALVLALQPGAIVRRGGLRRLTTELAEMYAGKGDKTLTRDLNTLVDLGLVRRHGRDGYEACIDVIDAFVPSRPRPEPAGEVARRADGQ